MKTKNRATRRAFTLVEIIVVIVILGVLATLIAPRLLNRIGQSKAAVATSNAANLANATRLMLADCGGRMPEGATILALWEKPGGLEEGQWKGPYVDSREQLKDPWGEMFILVVPGRKNIDFDIVSYGADKKPGGDGDDADIVKP
ncbi:MAG: type II secretion system major pseudopilin GspG [Phycisphaeraceae bacterium]|nr:type II secretion system major pseudopilin GspG [Phycisphaeraceae bacterium]MBX3406478.1 type II secretion system major pseudopilin GspG [Phycisphaeraceae bacterium]